jgi:3-phenylpropionate/cinnamic acid dioxygenase small subunit
VNDEITSFIFLENQLLDDGRYDAWVGLFADDGVYWVPGARADDPTASVNLIFDSKRRLAERLVRMKDRRFWAQNPRSRTTRLVGNLQVTSEAAPVEVRGKLVLVELRRGAQRVLSGTLEYRLDRVDGRLAIRQKKVTLIQANEPFDNLTFLV